MLKKQVYLSCLLLLIGIEIQYGQQQYIRQGKYLTIVYQCSYQPTMRLIVYCYLNFLDIINHYWHPELRSGKMYIQEHSQRVRQWDTVRSIM